MKKYLILFSLALLACTGIWAQKKISILGDSYSTFKGYVTPDKNLVWYPANQNDVTKVEQTWWRQFLNNYGYVLEVNNPYSG